MTEELEVIMDLLEDGADVDMDHLPRSESLPSYISVQDKLEARIRDQQLLELGTECSRCHFKTYYRFEVQKRRGDEPATVFEGCQNCGYVEHVAE